MINISLISSKSYNFGQLNLTLFIDSTFTPWNEFYSYLILRLYFIKNSFQHFSSSESSAQRIYELLLYCLISDLWSDFDFNWHIGSEIGFYHYDESNLWLWLHSQSLIFHLHWIKSRLIGHLQLLYFVNVAHSQSLNYETLVD